MCSPQKASTGNTYSTRANTGSIRIATQSASRRLISSKLATTTMLVVSPHFLLPTWEHSNLLTLSLYVPRRMAWCTFVACKMITILSTVSREAIVSFWTNKRHLHTKISSTLSLRALVLIYHHKILRELLDPSNLRNSTHEPFSAAEVGSSLISYAR